MAIDLKNSGMTMKKRKIVAEDIDAKEPKPKQSVRHKLLIKSL